MYTSLIIYLYAESLKVSFSTNYVLSFYIDIYDTKKYPYANANFALLLWKVHKFKTTYF